MIVLDTNVISELMRERPNAAVLAWVRSRDAAELSTTAITVAEIGYGIERLPDSRRRRALAAAALDIFQAFSTQVLSFDQDAAVLYGTVVTARERDGRSIDGFDAQIAAICRASKAALATRNTADFTGTGIALLNPWGEH